MADSNDVTPFVAFCRKLSRGFKRALSKAAKNNTFRYAYAVFGVLLLLGTTVFWAWLGARLQVHNADQLSDPYLFSDWKTFQGSNFPGSHTFLLKWPIFWLVSVFGVSATSLLVATVGVAAFTVAALAFILYRIDRRPMVFGTVCIGLSLALLLVPAQPYVGGLLPVNMAMLTTRNLEYITYLVALIFYARARRIRDWNFVLATVVLAVLIASDKLFLSLSAGGALLALVGYVLCSNWGMATFAARWLAGSVLATAGAFGIAAVISSTQLVHLINSTAATPYSLAHTAKELGLGAGYAVLGLFTNGGANPAYDNRVISQLPGQLVSGLWSFSGLAYILSALAFVYALAVAWLVLRPSLRSAPRRAKLPVANTLAWSLIWSTVAAVGVFVVTDHYFAVDARYLTISLFAAVISVSVWLRKHEWRWPEDLLFIACTLLLGVALAVPTALSIHTKQIKAYDTLNTRNELIAAALKQHKVDVLVGDYWRVFPVKLSTQNKQMVMPLVGCAQPAQVLTSDAWRLNLKKHSFAYLISLDKTGNLAGFPNCSLSEVTAKYGLPNATQIIAGTPTKPTEALLFYDQGSHPRERTLRVRPEQSVLPVALENLKTTSCAQPTTLNIVAHEDDDLLFLSPDLLHDIQAGRCVRTVYLTAGDAGSDKLYWLNRQLGSQAAYNTMLGSKVVWDQQTVELAPGQYVTVTNPHGNTKVSLVFFNLPDGGVQGHGFESSGYANLVKLYRGEIESLSTVDARSSYTSAQLVDALAMLMNAYQPASIHTQADVPSDAYPDHSDHITTGHYAQAAADQYSQQHFGGELAVPVTRYIGYPIHGYPDNVSGLDLTQKEVAFLAYAQYDGGVCQTLALCVQTPTYGAYISRQYTENPDEQ